MQEKVRIMVVEDEESLMDLITLNLELEGYDVVKATDGGTAIEKFKGNRFDLAILMLCCLVWMGLPCVKPFALKGTRLLFYF